MMSYRFIGHLNKDETTLGYFQEDGATVHTARVFMALLRCVFKDRRQDVPLRISWSVDFVHSSETTC
jgi:hypothetical protein